MDLPQSLIDALNREIRALWGSSCVIEQAEPVFGGDINEAAKLALSDGSSLFLKYNGDPLPRLFEVEERGLALLREAGPLRVPAVHALGKAAEGHPAYILMEWIETDGSRDGTVMGDLGRGLARLHQCSSENYGLDHDNYIGSLPQYNAPMDSWVAFYREQRLGVQRRLAQENGRLPGRRARLLDALMERLDRFIPEEEVKPSLLHGDLWGGNVLISVGEAVVIDPAVYFGHREVELAFTELFGGFSRAFYEAYDEMWPLPSEHRERVPLYQLYPLLVHLNLFGEAYGSRVDGVLRRYVG